MLSVPMFAIIFMIQIFFIFNCFSKNLPDNINLNINKVFNKDIGAEPTSLDPALATTPTDSIVLADLFEGLISQDGDKNIIPGVANSWKISKNGLVYTFYLRENAFWSDGKKVTANDFVYSFQRILDPNTAAPYADLAFPILNAQKINSLKLPLEQLGVKALNDLTLEIRLEYPTTYFLQLIQNPLFYPVRKDIIETHKKNWIQPENIVSNGAYKLKKWTINESITLVKNNNYWDASNTLIQKIRLFPITEANTAVKMFQTGQLDWIHSLPQSYLDQIKNAHSQAIKIFPILSNSYLLLNKNIPPLDNLKLRKALALSIDRQILTQKILLQNTPNYDLIPLGVINHDKIDPEEANWSKNKRIEIAQKLYKEAGYSKENPAIICMSIFDYNSSKKAMESIASMWKKNLGVHVEFQNMEWKVYFDNFLEKKFQSQIINWTLHYNDPQALIRLMTNRKNFDFDPSENININKILMQANLEKNSNNRKNILKKILENEYNKYIIIPLFSVTKLRLINPNLKGSNFDNPLDIHRSNSLYFVKPNNS